MSDRTAFYKAIWAAPDDDLPRLVFADWLDEHGHLDEAHFLRLLSAARTCPPDVDRLRPLVADLRRTMVTLPPDFLADACPVPPAVVVGPWVDVDHVANRGVLKWLQNTRTSATSGVRPASECEGSKPIYSHEITVAQRLWRFIGPVLSLGSNCEIDGHPAVVDVWSGVVMGFSPNLAAHLLRVPREVADSLPDALRTFRTLGRHARTIHVADSIGDDWIRGRSAAQEAEWVRAAVAEFDPANRPV
jgi:uncharacterized protein (TIGR02996 family)